MIEEFRVWRDYSNSRRGFLWEVSNFGRVKKNGEIIELNDDHGYFKVNSHWVHRMVAECFIGEIPKGYHVDHIDGNRKNNNINNLRIVTSKENHRNPVTRKRISISHKGDKNPSFGKQGTCLGRHREYNNDGTWKMIY